MLVKKRDGRLEKFKEDKPIDAMTLAGAKEHEVYAVMEEVYDALAGKDVASVEEIHTALENALMWYNKDAARNYIEYRSMRDRERDLSHSVFKSIKSIVAQTDATILAENANLDAQTFSSQRTLISNEVSKHIAKQLLPEEVAEAHIRGEIYWHDLGFSPALAYSNCCLVDVEGMLTNGFTLGSAHISTPKSITTATAIAAQIIAQVSSQQYGGTSLQNVDLLFAPYVTMSYNKHKETAINFSIPDVDTYAKKLTSKEVFDAFQALEYELNSLFNSHAQTPFTSISFGTGTSWEAREIQKAILKNRLAGLGKNKETAIFPKLSFFCKKGINANPEDPNYDIKQLALECTAKRIYPDWISYENNCKITGFETPVGSMGCRSFLSVWKNKDGVEVQSGRMNLGVVSLNVPRIALETKGDLEAFWKLLSKRVDLAHKALKYRIKAVLKASPRNAPTLYMNGAFGEYLKEYDSVKSLFENGRASISLGYIGISDTVKYLLDIDKVTNSPEAKKLAMEIVQFLRDKCDSWKKEEGWGYSLYGTPAESLCRTWLHMDRAEFGVVKHLTDKEYYTNSFHVPVSEEVDPFTKLNYEGDFHFISSGGHISYVEGPNLSNNLAGLEKILDYGMQVADYVGYNSPVDKCYVCGFEGELTPTSTGYHCKCGNNDQSKLSAIRRICGYLGNINVRPVNIGKASEFIERVKHV